MTEILIRHEGPPDQAHVFHVNATAFETDAEATLVDALRTQANPLISLVAVLEDQIVGHILFTPVRVKNAPDSAITLALGPMAVVPELQGQGIGTKLVDAGLEECRTLGAAAVFVLGHAEYYPRFGFEPAPPHGLRFKGEGFDPYFMVLELQPSTLSAMSGNVRYLPPFQEG